MPKSRIFLLLAIMQCKRNGSTELSLCQSIVWTVYIRPLRIQGCRIENSGCQVSPPVFAKFFCPVMFPEIDQAKSAQHQTGHNGDNKHSQTEQNYLEIFHEVIHTFTAPY